MFDESIRIVFAIFAFKDIHVNENLEKLKRYILIIALKCPLINASFCLEIYFIKALIVKVGCGVFFPV